MNSVPQTIPSGSHNLSLYLMAVCHTTIMHITRKYIYRLVEWRGPCGLWAVYINCTQKKARQMAKMFLGPLVITDRQGVGL